MCCSRVKREHNYKGSIWRENTIHPMSDKTVNKEYITRLRKEVIPCGGCDKMFNLGSNELKIHCNICEKFYHCNIAGECIGKLCSIKQDDGTIHRASYCINCVSKIFKNNTCLCLDCKC